MTERELFTEAVRRPTATERTAFLDGACPDPAVRRRVDLLLARHASPDPRLDPPADPFAALADGPPTGGLGPAVATQLAPFLTPSTRPGALGRLAQYDILSILGQGGCGIVARAFDDTLQRVVAVKVLAPHLAVSSPPRKRFVREARAVAQVRHDHVVQIHAVGEEPLPYLVMEFIDGPTLQQRLDEFGPLDPPEVARLGRQVALGLAAAHAVGFIHRDVKPANILLDGAADPRAKLTDFGLARAADDASLTQSGVAAGTPMYMSPEQVRGELLDARSDLFSLGSVLYTLVAGRPPFRASTAFAVLTRVTDDTPRPLAEVIGGVPPGLVRVIERLMAKRPADRYPSALAAADALATCLTAPATTPGRGRRAILAVGLLLAVAAGGWVAAHSAGVKSPPAVPPPEPAIEPAAASADPGGPPPLVVTSTRDDDTPGTLRWAVAQANARQGEDAITFDPAAFAAPQTITLTAGPLVFLDTARTTVTGPAAGLTVRGDGKTRVVDVGGRDRPAAAKIVDLTIADGWVEAEGPEQGRDGLGGGLLVWPDATLELTGCTIRDCTARTGGGLFVLRGTASVVNCTFARNTATEDGGALKVYGWTGRLTVANCTVVGNSAGHFGGGLLVNGGARADVANSLFFEQTARDLAMTDGRELTGDHNLTGDDTAPGANSLRGANPRLGPLGRHGGPTETYPLLAGSPALNAGDNTRLPAGTRTDQRGRPRVADGIVDIGAVEAK